MRRFLYYDEDSINSFLAQIEKGLLTKKGKEKEITDTVSSQLDTTADITGDLSAKVIGIGASLKGDIQTTDSDTEATSKLVKNVQEKVLHDYAFDKVFEYMTSDRLLVESPQSIGDIILLNEHPTFLDFEYFQKLSEIDVSGVEPSAHAHAMYNVMRDDVPTPAMPVQEALMNAPAARDNQICVPKVVDDA